MQKRVKSRTYLLPLIWPDKNIQNPKQLVHVYIVPLKLTLVEIGYEAESEVIG